MGFPLARDRRSDECAAMQMTIASQKYAIYVRRAAQVSIKIATTTPTAQREGACTATTVSLQFDREIMNKSVPRYHFIFRVEFWL